MNTFRKQMMMAAFLVIGGTAMGMEDKPLTGFAAARAKFAQQQEASAQTAQKPAPKPAPKSFNAMANLFEQKIAAKPEAPKAAAKKVVIINTRGADGLTFKEREAKAVAEAKEKEEAEKARLKAIATAQQDAYEAEQAGVSVTGAAAVEDQITAEARAKFAAVTHPGKPGAAKVEQREDAQDEQKTAVAITHIAKPKARTTGRTKSVVGFVKLENGSTQPQEAVVVVAQSGTPVEPTVNQEPAPVQTAQAQPVQETTVTVIKKDGCSFTTKLIAGTATGTLILAGIITRIMMQQA